MALSGWTWLTSGIIVSIMSGYLYLFVPKNGEKNMSMAFFFFVGMVFLTIGIIKLFFTRMDDKTVLDSIAKQPSQKIITIPQVENTERPNKVEERINDMLKQQEQKEKQPVAAHKNQDRPSHTNSFAHLYEYKGPVHTSSANNTQHPVAHHTAHEQASHPQHHVQNSEHGIKCRRCGNVNAGHANYCHSCGNRLK